MKTNSLLDIHPYQHETLKHIHSKLKTINPQKDYLQTNEQMVSILSFIYDIIDKDEAITKVLISADKKENIQSNFATKRIEKITRTYLRKAYFHKLKSNDSIHLNGFIRFITGIFSAMKIGNISHIKASATIHFKRIRNSFIQQHKRIKRTSKLDDLKTIFPDYDIESAYTYAIISNRFLLNQDDIEEFAMLVALLQNSYKNPKEKPSAIE